MKNIGLFDVEGTIIEEGAKVTAVRTLETALFDGIEMLVNFGALGLDKSDLADQWAEIKRGLLTDPKYFKRFFASAEEALAGSADAQTNVIFEAMKKHGTPYAGLTDPLMMGLISSGKIPIVPCPDVVDSMVRMYLEEVGVGTYSGGKRPLQEAMLSRVPTSQVSPANISELVRGSAGFHDKKEFGEKTLPDSYLQAARWAAGQGGQLAYWVTDGIGEAQACAAALSAQPQLFAPEMQIVSIDRRTPCCERTSEGILVVSKISYSEGKIILH